MTNSTAHVEIITSVQRRRRWTAPEKVRMVEETFEPGMTVSLVARRHGVAPNQLFTWRRLVAQGSLTAAGSGEEVVPASDYRALQNQVRELHRLLGKKTLEAEILKEALEHATGFKKTTAAAVVAAEGRFPMKTVAEVIGVSRSNLADRLQERSKKRIGRPPLPDDELVSKIKAVIAELPTYGYRRVHAVLKRQALAAGLKPSNHKRVYRVMKVHGLLLDRHVGGDERRHDGRIAVDERNRRWCSDGFEIGCDNGERVRVAFALDCCDREAMSFLATTGGIAGEDVRDLMVAAVEYRFGQVNRLPVTIEWLSDNGSCYVAGDTRSFARDIGLEPRTTPLESPQSNGMAEAFVRTIKRDYVRVSPRPDAETVMRQLPAWIAHYNEVHPHKALGYRSPREFIAAHARP
ncbi:MAG TPA: IS3 family transposase [Terriglobales bacterium]